MLRNWRIPPRSVVQSVFQMSGCLRNGYPKLSPPLKSSPALISGKSYCNQRIFFLIFYAWSSMSIPWAVPEGVSTSETLQKENNFIPSVVQLHISKFCSSQLPEGFAVTHLLSSCTLCSKLCPGSKTSHLRSGFQSALKSTGISNMFRKLLYLIRARGNFVHAGLKSVGLIGLQIIPLLLTFPGGLHLICSWIHWDTMMVSKTQPWQWLQDSSQCKFGVIPPPLPTYSNFWFFIFSWTAHEPSEKSEGMNPMK